MKGVFYSLAFISFVSTYAMDQLTEYQKEEFFKPLVAAIKGRDVNRVQELLKDSSRHIRADERNLLDVLLTIKTDNKTIEQLAQDYAKTREICSGKRILRGICGLGILGMYLCDEVLEYLMLEKIFSCESDKILIDDTNSQAAWIEHCYIGKPLPRASISWSKCIAIGWGLNLLFHTAANTDGKINQLRSIAIDKLIADSKQQLNQN